MKTNVQVIKYFCAHINKKYQFNLRPDTNQKRQIQAFILKIILISKEKEIFSLMENLPNSINFKRHFVQTFIFKISTNIKGKRKFLSDRKSSKLYKLQQR